MTRLFGLTFLFLTFSIFSQEANFKKITQLNQELLQCQENLDRIDSKVDGSNALNKLGLLGVSYGAIAAQVYLTLNLVELTRYYNAQSFPKVQIALEKISKLPFGENLLDSYITSIHVKERIKLSKNAKCLDLFETLLKGGVNYRRVKMRTFSDLGVMTFTTLASIPALSLAFLYLQKDDLIAPMTVEILDAAKLELGSKSELAKLSDEIDLKIQEGPSLESLHQMIDLIDSLIVLISTLSSQYDEKLLAVQKDWAKQQSMDLIDLMYQTRLCKLLEMKQLLYQQLF